MPRFAANLTMLYYAKALHCTQLNCLAGIAPPNVDRETLRATFVGNRRFAADALGGAGIRLLIEPINTYDIPGFFLSHAAQALEIIREASSANLFLQYADRRTRLRRMDRLRIQAEGDDGRRIELARGTRRVTRRNVPRHDPRSGG